MSAKDSKPSGSARSVRRARSLACFMNALNTASESLTTMARKGG